MKLQQNRLKTFLLMAVVLSVAGFHSVAQAAIVVNLEVNASQDQLVATTRGNCSQNNTHGCIQMSGNQVINFNMGNFTCASGDRWALSQVILGNAKNSSGNISADAVRDFNANQSSGVATPETQNANHIGVRNKNLSAYTIWYTVTATCDGATIKLDPRILNDGSGVP